MEGSSLTNSNPNLESQNYNIINILDIKEINQSDSFEAIIPFVLQIEKWLIAHKASQKNSRIFKQTTDYFIFIKQLSIMRVKVKDTVYSLILKQIVDEILKEIKNLKIQFSKQDLFNVTPHDFDINLKEAQQYLKIIEIKTNNPIDKIRQLTNLNNIEGKFSNLSSFYYCFSSKVFPLLQSSLLQNFIQDRKKKANELLRIIRFINQIYFRPFQLQIYPNKAMLMESKYFLDRIQRFYYQNYQNVIFSPLKKILNEALLCPSATQLQIVLFKILKRMYIVYKQFPIIHSIRNALFICIRSISLYSQHEEELKMCAIFCYKICKEQSDHQLINLFQTSEELRFIRNNKNYSTKALAFSLQHDHIYDILETTANRIKLIKNIPARKYTEHTVIVQKRNSLLVWQIKVLKHDIRFGLYKVDTLKQIFLNQYEKGSQSQQIIKLAPIMNVSQGNKILKTGIYKFIFDNTYSIMQTKDITFVISLFECIS